MASDHIEKNKTKTKDFIPSDLPFLPPNVTCNARLSRGDGYCKNAAGSDTNHLGIGRCRLHGGASPNQDAPDGPRDLFRSAGLDSIINLAEVMTHSDQEYLMHVGTNAMVVARAGVVARMQAPDTSPKELADLTMALTRLDNILLKHPDDEDPDAAPNQQDDAFRAEVDRLNELENL